MDRDKRGVFEKSVCIMSNILIYISTGLLFVMLLLGIADVTGRYLFSRPITGTIEIFEVLMPGMVLLGLAYTQRMKAHVTVDLFISWLPSKPRSIIGFVTMLWALVMFGIMVWKGIELAFLYRQMGRVINNIDVPMYLPRLLVPLGALAICMVFLVDLMHYIREMRTNG